MKKLIQFLIFSFVSILYSQNQMTIANPSEECAEEIITTIIVDNPGIQYAGDYNPWDQWSYELKLNGQTIHRRYIAPRKFVKQTTSNKYSYSFTIPNLSQYSSTGGNLKAYIEKINYNYIALLLKFESEQIQLCKPPSDDDGDGVFNSSDNCPNDYNPNQDDTDNDGIGDVCDSTDDSPKPDLTSKTRNIFVYSDCSSCDAQLSRLGSRRHILARTGGAMTIDAFVQNLGNANSSNFKVDYYLSIDSNLNSGDFKFPSSPTISGLRQNSEKLVSRSLNGFDVNSALPFQNYTLIIKIDSDDQITESKEDNNIFKIPVTYKSLSKNGPIAIDEDDEFGFKSSSKPYNLHIYDIYGQQIKTVLVKSKAEEKFIIKGLRNGLYILNTESGSRKIYVGN